MTAGGRPAGRETILILDFGAQYSQLIARRVRELNVYSELLPFDVPLETLRQRAPAGIILSGGPDSVYSDNAPRLDPALFDLGIPILGIGSRRVLACGGLQPLLRLVIVPEATHRIHRLEHHERGKDRQHDGGDQHVLVEHAVGEEKTQHQKGGQKDEEEISGRLSCQA